MIGSDDFVAIVSVETARSRFKRAFGKTVVNRQGALIALAPKASKC